MAQDRKRGFFSSLFRTKHRTEAEQSADLDTRLRLEARIQQILADRTDVPNLLIDKDENALIPLPLQVEPQIDVLPITASVLSKPKAPVAAPFLVEIGRPYAANDRW